MTLEEAAQEIIGAVSSAAGDIAYDMPSCPSTDWEDWVASHQDVRDKVGAYADYLFCSKDFVKDLIGDRSFDIARGDRVQQNAILAKVKEVAPSQAFKDACDELLELNKIYAEKEPRCAKY